MNTTQLEVDNIKCGGCANSIESSLDQYDFLSEIEVDYENGLVKLSAKDELNEEQVKMITNKLNSLGYPLKGQGHIGHKAKSFLSCAIGKMKS